MANTGMKSIAIVTENWNDTLGEFLRKNLLSVFDGYAEIESYYLDRFPADDLIWQDVVLVMTTEMGVNVHNRTSDAKKILLVNRTIGKSEIYKIFSIPSGTRVLVVNDNNVTTMEMVSLLMHLGIDHLDLVPYDPKRDYFGIKIAITPGERFFVPQYIDTIIDTGHRYIDISTFILLMDMLKIPDHEVGTRLHDYSETIIPLESGINSQYKQLYMKNLELESVLNLTHEGILLIDNEGSVLLHSKALRLMLDLKTEIVGRRLSDHIGKPLFDVLQQESFSDEPVQYKGRSFLVSGRRIEQYGKDQARSTISATSPMYAPWSTISTRDSR